MAWAIALGATPSSFPVVQKLSFRSTLSPGGTPGGTPGEVVTDKVDFTCGLSVL
jgi:hypothetical protein